MQIKRLTLTNVRVFERAEFDFQPGMNLLVGINGAGKSTVLDVLRTLYSQIMPDFTAATTRQSFDFDKKMDISYNSDFLSAELLFSIDDTFLQYSIYRPRQEFIIGETSQQESSRRGSRPGTKSVLDREGYEQINLRDRNTLIRVDANGIPLIRTDNDGETLTDEQGEPLLITPAIPKHLRNSNEQPIVLYFSPHRSLPLDNQPSKTASSGGQRAAFADALNHRELRMREYAEWWLVKYALSKEDAQEKRFLDLLEQSTTRLLGQEYTNLHAINKLLSVGIDGDTVKVRSLPYFHQCLIVLFLEIARHLETLSPQTNWNTPIDIDFEGNFLSSLMSNIVQSDEETAKALQQFRRAFYNPDTGRTGDIQVIRFKPTNTISMNDQEFVILLDNLTEWWLNTEILAEENREVNLFASQMRSAFVRVFQEVKPQETSAESKGVDADEEKNFPHYDYIHIETLSPRIMIRKQGTPFELDQLSDGEGSMLALVFDLSRRLALANPQLNDPIHDGKAVVLIDELDLHLHPSWQRMIVDRLTRTFPNCQFIATTHSPQIVGEVRSEQVILIENGTARRPEQSLGMDTNWILRHLMGVAERETDTKQELNRIEALIESEEYDQAEVAIEQLRATLGDFPGLVSLQTRIDMIEFLDDEEDDAE
jgi:energy-coupling factor transporter ATP-binding protein EcfA2